MTWDPERDRVRRTGRSHGARRAGPADRVRDLRVLEDAYPDDCPTLLSGWRALQEQYAASVLARA